MTINFITNIFEFFFSQMNKVQKKKKNSLKNKDGIFIKSQYLYSERYNRYFYDKSTNFFIKQIKI